MMMMTMIGKVLSLTFFYFGFKQNKQNWFHLPTISFSVTSMKLRSWCISALTVYLVTTVPISIQNIREYFNWSIEFFVVAVAKKNSRDTCSKKKSIETQKCITHQYVYAMPVTLVNAKKWRLGCLLVFHFLLIDWLKNNLFQKPTTIFKICDRF